jgi:pyruvate/2-oxoglutarate/acetoin dehydrogenase E1 component
LLYGLMLRSRLYEGAIAKLWHDGLISGETHLGTGEEGIVAGVVSQLGTGDGMALDHRGTAALLMRGVDPRLIVFGEDVPMLRRDLLVRFGPARVRGTPISQSAFLGAGVAPAMAGLRPVVEMCMVDFIGVCMDALLDHAAKLEAFSGGRWTAPLVVRAPCSGGYGDSGQHEQSLWGRIAHIPGLAVVVPSVPSDARGLMLAALQHDGPVVFCEPKLLSDS